MTERVTVVLTIAGSDPSGGAGIQGDLHTFAAHGAYGCAVITLLTAQNTRGVDAVQVVPAPFVRRQLEVLLADIRPAAIKIGALGSAAIVEVVADVLSGVGAIPIVLDPIARATSGAPLLDPRGVESLRRRLLPLVTVVTPNLDEAGMLLDRAASGSRAEMVEAAHRIRGLGANAVLITGGHLDDPSSTDLLLDADGSRELDGLRLPVNKHGTGCALTASLAVHLARGVALAEACARAKAYVTAALRSSDRLQVGRGRGPLDFWVHA